jgi:hypothetical protein
MPPPFRPRQVVHDVIWAVNPRADPSAKLGTQLLFICWPTEHPKIPANKIHLRIFAWEVTLINQISPHLSEYVSMSKLDLAGNMPASTSNSISRGINGTRVAEIQAAFLRRVPLSECSADDGMWFAHSFLKKHNKKHNKTFANSTFNVASVIDSHMALRQVNRDCAGFSHIITAILDARLGLPLECDTPLVRLSPSEAKRIGSNLSISLLSSPDLNRAVKDWILAFPALVEMRERYIWFEPLIVTLASRALVSGHWGLKARVIIGVILSTADIITDIFMVLQFKREGNDILADATVACCCFCMLIQIFTISIQHHKAGFWKVFIEILFILTFTKPAVDAFHVASGKEQTSEMVFDPLFELSLVKGCEMVVESIPGSIIQTYALIMAPVGTRSTTAIFSLAVSMGTTAFSTSMMCYDFDASPSRRRDQPKLYGLTGDKGSQKLSCFIAMFVLSLTHITSRIFATALIASVSGALALSFLVGEMLLYLGFKIARDDFIYWVPADSNCSIYFGGMLVRVLRKILVDFTGILQERHPFEMGGLVFLANMIWSQTFPYVAKEIYYSHFQPEEFNVTLTDGSALTVTNELPEENTMFLLSCLTTVWACAGALLYFNMDHRLIPSFFTTMTAPEYAVSLFHASETDEARFNAVFTNHDSYTMPIRQEVKEWVLENYAKWDREKPAWFSEANVACIPTDMIPIPNLEALLEAGGGERAKRPSILMQRASLSLPGSTYG